MILLTMKANGGVAELCQICAEPWARQRRFVWEASPRVFRGCRAGAKPCLKLSNRNTSHDPSPETLMRIQYAYGWSMEMMEESEVFF